MTLPRPLVLFLAFCGGGALFAMPLLMAALALGTPASPAAAADSPTPQPSVTTGTDEVLGTLTFHAFDLGFDPAGIEVDQPGRYAISFVNDGAILHNITFADGTVLEADGARRRRAKWSCQRTGSGTCAPFRVTPKAACRAPSPSPAGPGRARTPGSATRRRERAIEPDPNAPEYTPRDAAAPQSARARARDRVVVNEHG